MATMNVPSPTHRKEICQAGGRRRAMGVIPVIAALAIAVTMCAVWTKSCLLQHREQLLGELRTQARWLAEAGVRRGAAQLAVDSEYRSETWLIDAAELGERRAATVEIRVEPSADEPRRVRIRAAARLPRDNPRVAISHSVIFTLPGEPSS
jgi:hypothetical protein